MILGTDAIKAALADGAIVCNPAPTRVEGAHIDVTLGRHYWVCNSGARLSMGNTHMLALREEDPTTVFELRGDRNKWGGNAIIPAHGFVLCHTQEYIGTAPGSGLLPVLHTRSTLARWGLSAHQSAGFGDEGYCSRWTLEIANPHPVAVAIPVGARVGCIAFERIEGAVSPYTPGTRYNATAQEWSPEAMLPRRGNW